MLSQIYTGYQKNALVSLNFAVLSISSSLYDRVRSKESIEDQAGNLTAALLSVAGQEVVFAALVPDNPHLIKKSLKKILQMPNVDVVIICGGTSINNSNVTLGTINSLLETDIPGFGEHFKHVISETSVPGTIMTEITAGLKKGKAIFYLPRSPQDITIAVNRLIIPEIGRTISRANFSRFKLKKRTSKTNKPLKLDAPINTKKSTISETNFFSRFKLKNFSRFKLKKRTSKTNKPLKLDVPVNTRKATKTQKTMKTLKTNINEAKLGLSLNRKKVINIKLGNAKSIDPETVENVIKAIEYASSVVR